MPSAIAVNGAPHPPTTPHIPAWRRLGLKLKFAEDTAEPLVPAPGVQEEGTLQQKEKKRKRGSLEHEDAESKKPKTKKRTEPGDFTPDQASLRRQKSVSFTPETKVKDGDSVKQLFNSWVDEQKADDSSFDPATIAQALQTPAAPVVTPSTTEHLTSHTSKPENLTSHTSKPEKRNKTKEKRRKRAGVSTDATQTTSSEPYVPPHLVYLTQHHTARPAWKFNKAKQTHLLKHLFDFSQIPTRYNAALSGYIVGLQGDAARSRVREAANKIITEDEKLDAPPTDDATEEEMADYKRKHGDYHEALGEFVHQMQTAKMPPPDEDPDPANLSASERLRVRKRAEMTLWLLSPNEPSETATTAAAVREEHGGRTTAAAAVGEGQGETATPKRIKLDLPSVIPAQPTGEKGTESGQARRRNRKKRTNGVSDDESSSSSSSDDETSSSGTGTGSSGSEGSRSEGDETSSGSETGSGSEGGSGSERGKEEGDEDDETSSSSSSSSSSGGEERGSVAGA